MKIQLDLSEEQNKIVEVYKLVNNLNTKQEAIKQMIEFFKVEIKPKNITKTDYFK
jgi:hypothetical protein